MKRCKKVRTAEKQKRDDQEKRCIKKRKNILKTTKIN